MHRRAIALVLVDLLRNLYDRLGFLRPQAVVGSNLSTNPTYFVELSLHSGFHEAYLGTSKKYLIILLVGFSIF